MIKRLLLLKNFFYAPLEHIFAYFPGFWFSFAIKWVCVWSAEICKFPLTDGLDLLSFLPVKSPTLYFAEVPSALSTEECTPHSSVFVAYFLISRLYKKLMPYFVSKPVISKGGSNLSNDFVF